jgi:hypothetical protein
VVKRRPTKKEIEQHYTEEARRASSLFPAGALEPPERPDFLVRTAAGVLGIEVTELCREEPRAESGRLSKVADAARKHYNQLPGSMPVDVSFVFSRGASAVHFNALTDSLVNFVRDHAPGSSFKRDLPSGYSHIGIHTPFREPLGNWHAPRAFNVVPAAKSLLETRIAGKNQRIADYRSSASTVWLLIVNDNFLGPGEVVVRRDELAEWTFTFAFDKVLLFQRQPGGDGHVIALRRA